MNVYELIYIACLSLGQGSQCKYELISMACLSQGSQCKTDMLKCVLQSRDAEIKAHIQPQPDWPKWVLDCSRLQDIGMNNSQKKEKK